MQHPIELMAVVDERATGGRFLSLPLVRTLAALEELDAAVLTDLSRPQRAFQSQRRQFDEQRIIVPPLLKISREMSLVPQTG